MGFLIDISDDAIANPCISNIVKLSACQNKITIGSRSSDSTISDVLRFQRFYHQ